MLNKLMIILGSILFIIWFFFLRKKRSTPSQSSQATKATAMVECKRCKTFIPQDETILSNGAYYCSKECLFQESK